MEEEPQLERNLLHVARLLVSYWIVSWAVTPFYLMLTSAAQRQTSFDRLATLIAIDALALALLFWPTVQRRLGRAFVPLVIALTTLPFFLERYWYMLAALAPGASQTDFWRAFTLRQDVVLLALLIAWHYRKFYQVTLFTAIVTLADWAMTVWLTRNGGRVPADFLGVLLSRAVILLLIGYVVTWLRRQQWQQQRALVEANERQIAANTTLARYAASVEQLSISRERNRLARELHDTLAHSLSALSVQLEAVRSLWDVDARAARQMLGRADETTRTGLTEARRSLQALRATPLEEFGLALALRDLAESAASRADATLTIEVPDLAVNLPSDTEQSIYRVAQEALENIVRHARASQVNVTLRYAPPEVTLAVADNGVGFAPDAVGGHQLGIAGMRERAVMVGGTLQISSAEQQGTRISLSLRPETDA